jgi:hypothetical protein
VFDRIEGCPYSVSNRDFVELLDNIVGSDSFELRGDEELPIFSLNFENKFILCTPFEGFL